MSISLCLDVYSRRLSRQNFLVLSITYRHNALHTYMPVTDIMLNFINCHVGKILYRWSALASSKLFHLRTETKLRFKNKTPNTFTHDFKTVTNHSTLNNKLAMDSASVDGTRTFPVIYTANVTEKLGFKFHFFQ